jgi:hypothetical protein
MLVDSGFNFMSTSDVQRQQLIQTAMANCVGEVADVAVDLWQALASQLISIVGEGGFNSLYARSIYLTRAAFPWLALIDASRVNDFKFTDLKNSLERQNIVEANKASYMLLLTFTNTLASLIGESLTLNLLSSAWGVSASDMDTTGKELPHE